MVTNMRQTVGDCGLRLLVVASLMTIFGNVIAPAQEGQPVGTQAGKPPYNIIFVISDQRTYRLLVGDDYSLPGIEAIARHGVTFRNHYIASAMCSPSRAAFLTGQPPQVNGVFDQMQYDFVPTLSPDLPNMGSVLKGLGYRTAYFGKFEMDKKILAPEPTVNYSRVAQPYGFEIFGAGGDIGSAPRDGFINDPFIAGESVRWLRETASEARQSGPPFFMVASFVNPHDIMFGNGNIPGQPPVQIGVPPQIVPPPPESSTYRKTWSFTLPPSLRESLTAPGMPGALSEYNKGWNGWSGAIPTNRSDMWSVFYNYYLNTIRDEDRSLQQIVDVMNDMDLWRNTVVVYTADHGEMAGAHGGLKGKGPFSYEANAHVPLVIAHPAAKAGAATTALTSHLDLLPTFVGLTGLPDANRSAAVRALPGRDFSAVLRDPEKADVHTVRPGVLFNYVGASTVDGEYLNKLMSSLAVHQPQPPVTQVKLDKRGFLSFVFDGRYKLARYYAPAAFNAPQTLEELLRNNDVQLFDLESDPEEMHNLALEPKKNRATILRMNGLLNELMAKEVGVNDGRFLPQDIRPK